MKQNNKKNIIFRFEVAIASMLVFAILIVLELTRTTVVMSDKWNAKAESLINTEGTIVPQRGDIYSDNGNEAAKSKLTELAEDNAEVNNDDAEYEEVNETENKESEASDEEVQ